ncbi:AraC family transcriptional regulator [Marinomonas sp. S3726]|uniref:helix-turn-helix domain-containing protein n=1 Tax=Marinomonas sp. S3726 TaxID=579484 RepID=UPI0005FA2A07|nr:helix-turn-helix domain-containing protein [Marinomonas sp. S3726]KJZ10943.1 AraC family transcriptional regulator [Marinomonas sp. S3726]
MINWIQAPKSEVLSNLIECYWFIEKTKDAASYPYPKLNPDPSAHLILSPSDQAYFYGLDLHEDEVTEPPASGQTGVSSGLGSHWLYPHQQTLQLDHRQAFVHLGIKFRPGALYRLNLNENDEFDSQAVLNQAQATQLQQLIKGELLTKENLFVEELISIARKEPQLCCDQLDKLLLPWLNHVKKDRHSLLVGRALPLVATTNISSLGKSLNCSQRTLERSFIRVTGLSLKQYQAMNKLEVLLEHLYQKQAHDIDWVEVAFEFGFSDQPHLIRHLKKQLGQTPKRYAKERGFTIDVYGGVSSS